MAEIVCIECKATVSDLSGSCPECGYPFDAADLVQDLDATGNTDKALPNAVEAVSLEPVIQALDLLRSEITGLRSAVGEIRQSFDTQATQSAENTLRLLSEVNSKMDAVISYNNGREKEAQAAAKEKQSLPPPKTAGSSGGMIEYMFYICAAQIVFVIVNLFLAAYIVTMLRE